LGDARAWDNGIMSETEQAVCDDVEIANRHAACVVTLQRPAALNALTDEMRAAIGAALTPSARDPIIYALVIRSGEGRAFCAGGDVRQIVDLQRTDVARARKSFAEEYALNWRLECFPKPSIALMNGYCAGSGNGLTQYATHRVGGPDYQFAMPETAIGLFPDVGVSHRLSRLPDEVGTYLALTGNAIGAADSLRLGLLTHVIPADALDAIVAGLSDADPVDPLLDSSSDTAVLESMAATPLAMLQPTLKEVFAGDDLVEIFARLDRRAEDSDETVAQWARETLAVLGTRSPLALHITLRHIRNVAALDIRETLIGDYRLASHILDGPELAEGVRALLIDKDKQPRWAHASVRDVDAATVERYFTPHPAGDLVLATRDTVQQQFR
jgi:enoyl-CoA hydratase